MSNKKLVAVFISLLIIPITSFLLIHYQLIHPIAIKIVVEKFGIFAPTIFVVIFIIATVLFIPGMPLSLAGGLIFGLPFGVLYNMIGTALGATSAFLLARYYGQDWIKDKAGSRLHVIMNGVDKNGWRYVALLRLMPLTPFALLNYIFGITPIRLTHFILASFIFSAPGCYAFAYLGHLGNQLLFSDVIHVKRMLLGVGIFACMLFIAQIIKNIYFDKEY